MDIGLGLCVLKMHGFNMRLKMWMYFAILFHVVVKYKFV